MTFKEKLYIIVEDHESPQGKIFDYFIQLLILLSLVAFAVDTLPSNSPFLEDFLNHFELFCVVIFSIEYVLRVYVAKNPFDYIFSFYGIIDLLATIPKYLALIFVGAHVETLMAIRALRILRIFRVLHISRYIGESNFLVRALLVSRAKIIIFLLFVVIMCIVFGTIMYLVEGPESGFNNIPTSIYWCIVTITTVGYGDIAPITMFGQFIASVLMILGYGIIAVPTGIISAQMVQNRKDIDVNTIVCTECLNTKHKDDAIFCGQCGSSLKENVHREDE